MSLSVDGVWRAGVWATTVWADGVWREGDAPPVVDDDTVVVPAGSSRKRTTPRFIVTIDGQDFGVNDAHEANQLLQQARAIAERQAEQRASVAESNVTRIAQRTGVVHPVRVIAPKITASPELDLSPLISDIERLYQRAGELAELRILLQKQMDEEDEDDLLLLL